MSYPEKVLIVAPFWGNVRHVGCHRIDRFIRWLTAVDSEIILVKAGAVDGVRETNWGKEITVRDPLGLYTESQPDSSQIPPKRRPSRLRRYAAYFLFNPDPTLIWARQAIRCPLVRKVGRVADLVISSSPPESAHVAAAELARSLNAQLLVDMRDGWLDEPIKPLLQKYQMQRWREGRLERRILRQAEHILVTSDVWRELLCRRLPFTENKITVLTNAYPPDSLFAGSQKQHRKSDRLTLIHAGRFGGSRKSQKIEHLMRPLLDNLDPRVNGEVVLVGDLEPDELVELGRWSALFEKQNWSMQSRPAIPRADLLDLLQQANGLLLLSVSHAAIPSKVFEYVAAGKPILALTKKGSAVWHMSEKIAQMFVADYSDPKTVVPAVPEFLESCQNEGVKCDAPPEYSENYLSQIFLKVISKSRY
jgi:glycosyltransferase involved in cell wall biosynthesis